jgi:hypothetical protein
MVDKKWLQRERDIFATFDVSHYRPKKRPNAVRVLHEKTREENWIPLFHDGGPHYPELMAELDALKRARIGGLILRRDWGDRRPWPIFSRDDIDLTHMSRKVKDVIRAAGLRDELTFTSFRHGGFTEGADADLSDAQMRAQGRPSQLNRLANSWLLTFGEWHHTCLASRISMASTHGSLRQRLALRSTSA